MEKEQKAVTDHLLKIQKEQEARERAEQKKLNKLKAIPGVVDTDPKIHHR